MKILHPAQQIRRLAIIVGTVAPFIFGAALVVRSGKIPAGTEIIEMIAVSLAIGVAVWFLVHLIATAIDILLPFLERFAALLLKLFPFLAHEEKEGGKKGSVGISPDDNETAPFPSVSRQQDARFHSSVPNNQGDPKVLALKSNYAPSSEGHTDGDSLGKFHHGDPANRPAHRQLAEPDWARSPETETKAHAPKGVNRKSLKDSKESTSFLIVLGAVMLISLSYIVLSTFYFSLVSGGIFFLAYIMLWLIWRPKGSEDQ